MPKKNKTPDGKTNAEITPPDILADLPQLPAACQQLSPQKLKFALAFVFEVPAGPGAVEAAGALAGYSKVEAAAVANDPAVVQAIEELSRQELIRNVPLALAAVRKILKADTNKDTLNAAKVILDRAIPAKQEIKVEQTTKIDTQAALLKEFQRLKSLGVSRDALIATFGKWGVERLEAMAAENAKMIDAKVIANDDRTDC